MDTVSVEEVLATRAQERETSAEDKRPDAKDLSHHLSELSKRRRPSPLKELFQYIHPGILSFAGGMPSPLYFPLEKLSAAVPDAAAFTQPNSHKSTSTITVPKYPADIPINLSVLLQYGMVTGLPAFNAFLMKFVEKVYIPAYKNYDILLSCGNTDALYKIFNMLLDPGDFVIVEEFTYPSALECMHPLQVQTVPIKMDREGMLDTDLEDILSNWDLSWRNRGKRPKMMYTVTVGQNPTGGTLSLERRKKIYAICQKYDVLIVEDDPYYFLQMPDYGSENNRYPASETEFLDSLIPSYLRIDVDGRVLRCDSFSKVIAPGSRAGWITAAPIFIERLTRHAEVGTQATSGWAQSFIAKLLVDEWKMSGWIEWLKGLGFEYTKRRDYIVGAMNEEFDVSPASTEEGDYIVLSRGKSLISFVPPMAGMFLWIRVALEEHPRYDGENAVELMDELWKRIAVKEDLLIAPGRMFAAGDEQRGEAAKYFRVAFSVGEKKEVDEMVKRFGRAVRWFFKGKT